MRYHAFSIVHRRIASDRGFPLNPPRPWATFPVNGPPVSAGFVAQSRLTPKFLGDAYVDGACFAADRIPAVNNGCEELVEFGHFCASDVFGVSILMMSAIGTHATVELANHDVLVVLLYPGFGEVSVGNVREVHFDVGIEGTAEAVGRAPRIVVDR